ncbi:MAG: DUF4175 domain-containing protein [Cyanobacteria bacterium]|nr:DUF4175 domain-containing protein [Cyanobacteriota bacterium]
MGEVNARAQLLEVVRQVRRRWRIKLALRGAGGFLLAGLIAILAIAYTLEALKFTPAAIFWFRIVTALVFVAAGAWFFARPLSRRVTDEQVAMYLEEHEPTLDSAILSAMEATDRPNDWSPELIRRLVENAIERVHQIQEGERIEREPMKRYVWFAGAVAVAAIALFTFGPAYFRHTLSAIFVISTDAEAAAPYKIDVKPGDATVAKGADQMISATLSGFDAADAAILIRKGSGGAFERVPMVKAENGSYEGMLFDLSEPLDYVVEAAGVRSAPHKLNVLEVPYAKKIDLDYTYPSYTGLEPRKIEDGGDIAVLKGTDVKLTITPTMASKGGRVVLGEKESVPLSVNSDGTLSANFTAQHDGFYRVELDAPNGERLTASPQYTVDLLSDLAPTVKLSKPGRDTDATPVEEFFIEAKADDDYAVKNLQLVYQINGGAEKVIPLFGGARPTAEVTAGHTFYMEELGVKAGDSVSYYARATDNDAINGSKQTSSDIYFLRIRPFDKNFKPAASMSGGGGGGGGGGQEVGALSQQQRQIISGTFNIQRDRKTMTAAKVREGLVVLTLAQSKLRDQVNGLVERMNSRLVVSDPSFKKIAELLPKAAEQMTAAEKQLQAQSAEKALPPENMALQFLQQAEEEFELQVQMGRQAGGGGGGGGAGSIANDLADLFKMEMDKMANQYETNSQASTQQQDQQIDELAEKLKELARRQEQEIERQRRLAAGQSAGSQGGDLQRALAEQAEEAARQLEKLSRDQQRQDLADTARQLRNAADAMRRAAAKGDPSAAGQAAAAADRLREAQRQLTRNQTARGERDVKDAQRQAAEIAQEQQDIARDAGQLGQAGPDRLQKAQMLGQRKDALESKVSDLEKQLDRMVGEQTRESRETGRKLSEAASGIRDNKIKEKIRYSKSLLGTGAPEQYARNFEEEIGANIDQLRKKLDEASAAAGQQRGDRSGDAVDKARELARGVDSLGRRMQERGAQNAQQRGSNSSRDSNSSNGQQGREGQQGQSGKEGQNGKEGSQGQSGQQGQGGQQGSQGQNGQGGQQGQGQEGQGGRNGDGNTMGGAPNGGWGGGDRRAGGPYGYYFGPDDVRQFRGEARRWAQEGQALRNMLREQNVDPKEFDEIMRRLRELDSERVYQDVEELARLQTFVAEGLKRFEYALRRKVGDETDRALVSGSEEVPAEFKALVEEYYRSLSKGQKKQ